MKCWTFIAFLFLSLFKNVFCTDTNLQMIQTFTEVQNKLNEIQRSANVMSDTHPDPELDLLQMFKPIIDKIHQLKYFDIEHSLRQISNESEYVLNPLMKFSTAKNQIDKFYNTLENFANQKVFVDEVKIDEWLSGHNSETHLDILHELIVSPNRSDSLPFKLYLALWYQVIISFEKICTFLKRDEFNFSTGWKTFMFTWTISTSSHLQPLQCHCVDRNQRICNDSILLHDYETFRSRKFHYRSVTAINLPEQLTKN